MTPTIFTIPTVPSVIGWRVDANLSTDRGVRLLGPYWKQDTTARVITSTRFGADGIDKMHGVSACTTPRRLAAVIREVRDNTLDRIDLALSRVELTDAREWPVSGYAGCDGPGSWAARSMTRLELYSTAAQPVRDRLAQHIGVPVYRLAHLPDRDELADLMELDSPPSQADVDAALGGG